MDMSDRSTNSTMLVMMIPWLHFTGGDNLLFKSIHPSSHGAVAGACIFLVILAIFERWISAMRSHMEVFWSRRYVLSIFVFPLKIIIFPRPSVKALIASQMKQQSDASAPADDVKSLEYSAPGQSDAQKAQTEQTSLMRGGRVSRISPPFIASYDIPRGIIFAFQALLAYILMLAVMWVSSFNRLALN